MNMSGYNEWIEETSQSYVRESPRELHSGIFWVLSDHMDLTDHKLLMFEIPCDVYGNITGHTHIELNAKSGTTYNHKKLWENVIQNNSVYKPYNKKPYDHYPRGRIEIANNRATIYLNSNINETRFISEIKQKFGLTEYNISEVRVLEDNSSHYQCFIDREDGAYDV